VPGARPAHLHETIRARALRLGRQRSPIPRRRGCQVMNGRRPSEETALNYAPAANRTT